MTVWVPFYCDSKVLDGRQYFQIGKVIIAIRPTFIKYTLKVDFAEETPSLPLPLVEYQDGNMFYPEEKTNFIIPCPMKGCSKTFSKDEFLIDHFMKKHTMIQETDVKSCKTPSKRKCGGGNGEQREDNDNITLHKRCDVFTINIPDVKLSNTELFLPNSDDNLNILNDPKGSLFMPPADQLEKINNKFRTDHSLVEQLDYGTFNKDSIQYFKKLHSYKLLLQKVLAEENWFSDIPHFFCQSPLSNDNIKIFKDVLFNNSDSKVININSKQIEIRDLSDLCCDRWLNDSVISNLVHLINKDINVTKCFVYVLNSLEDMQNLADTVRDTFCNNFNGVRIAFCTHVGNVSVYSFLDSCVIDGIEVNANHFTSCVYSFDSNQIVYCDPLGWNIPGVLLQKLSTFLQFLHVRNFSLILCHDPYSFIQSENSQLHVCSNKCSPFYFVQKCSAVCGVAALVTLVIMSYKWTLFEKIVNSAITNQIQSLTYLKNISSFSKFLRLAIIDWLISGAIEIKKILKVSDSNSEKMVSPIADVPINLKCSQTEAELPLGSMQESIIDPSHTTVAQPPFNSNSMQKDYVAEKINTDQTDIPESDIFNLQHTHSKLPKSHKPDNLFLKWQLDTSSIEKYICSKPEVSYIKCNDYVRVRLRLKNGSDISKTFSCNNDLDSAKDSIKTFMSSDDCIKWVQAKISDSSVLNKSHIPNCFPGINDLLSRPYQLTYLRGKLRVRCYMRNGHTKDKYFPCSTMGKDDLQAVKSVEMFFKTKECLDWLSGETWVKTGSVPVGPQTKQYINAINFDVTKQYIIHKDVEKIYDPETLSVSVVEHKKWGKTNRTDQTYCLQTTDDDFTAVILYIKCSSKSDICRGDCGILVTACQGDSDICPNCNKQFTSSVSNECHNCKSANSSQWMKDRNGNTICKTCYQYYRRNKKVRTNIINAPKTALNSHYTCKWQIKLVLESKDLTMWHIYEAKSNIFYHPSETIQESRRANLQTRDTWDILRISTKATPQQIFSTENRAKPIRLATLQNNYHNLHKIKARCRTVDKHYLKSGIKMFDEIPINSDWRTCEKILEGNYRDVLIFQRGNDQLKRCYHIVLSRDENTHHLREFGKHILGYDIKQDFMSARFKTACLTYTDAVSNGRAGAVAVCNCEDENSHALTLQIVLGNIPCGRFECQHERKLYIYNDNSGFFWQRECAFVEPICPIIQHDKAQDIRNAAIHLNLQSTLCNFHALKAYRSFIRDNSELELFIRPLETAFKCIMRSWNKNMTENLIERYKNFVNDFIPSELMTRGARTSLLIYMDRQWFSSCWQGVFTAEVFQYVPMLERRDPLILTDNITERMFKDFDENDFGSHLNRSMAIFVMKVLNSILYRETIQTKESKGKTRSCPDKLKEMTLALMGINIALEKKVITYENRKETGWALVTSETKTVPKLSDDFFVSGSDEDSNICPDIPQPTSNALEEVHKNSSSLVREHGYSVVDKCKRIVSDLNMLALNMFYQENLSYLPSQLHPFVKKNTHICNIKLCTCTCFHFIVRGQPYFCKHLYGCLAEFHSIYNNTELLNVYLKTYPSFPSTFAPYLTQTLVPSPVFDRLQQLMNISHLAREDETNAAREGKILKTLHTSEDSGTTFTGRPAQRRAHNAGFRSVHGPVSDKYPLVDAEVGSQQDPYKPNVKFPENSRERHGGRKVKTLSKRGVSFSSVMHSAMKKLGIKVVMKCKNTSKLLDTVDGPTNREAESIQNSVSKCSQINDAPDINNLSDTISRNSNKQQPHKPASVKRKNNYIMCAKCIKEGISLPFTCASKPELDKHMSSKHKEDNYLCAYCYSQYGALTYFATDRQLKQHQKDHAPPNDSNDQTHLSIASGSESSSMTMSHFLKDKQPRTQKDQPSNVSSKLTALDAASPSELNVLTTSKEPGIANLAKMKLNQIDITPKTASDLLKEKENEGK